MITSLVASGFDPVTTAAVVGDHIQILAQVPDLNPQQPPGGEKFISLAGWIKWGVMLASVLALLFAGDVGLLLPTYTQVFMKAIVENQDPKERPPVA